MKTIIVTPAGRQRYLEILVKYLDKQKEHFNEWHLWVNTANQQDMLFCKQLEKEHAWIKAIDLEVPFSGINSINSFFKHAMDSDTIYIRLDDDIVYLEPEFVSKMVNNRLKYTDPPFIYPLIINNGNICSYIAREKKFTDNDIDEIHHCQNNLFYSPEKAYGVHQDFIGKVKTSSIDHFYIDNVLVDNFHRISINSISWFGETIQRLNGHVPGDEEQYLSVHYPKTINQPNLVCGDVICSHFAFVTQREFLDKTDLLETYKKLSNES
jgi:hypothetical protein